MSTQTNPQQQDGRDSTSESANMHEKINMLIGKALKFFNQVYEPFTKQFLKHVYKTEYHTKVKQFLATNDPNQEVKVENLDSQGILNLLTRAWPDIQNVPNCPLQHNHRGYLFELKAVRNKWAHQYDFSLRDAYRALDTCDRLLSIPILRAESQQTEIRKMMDYVLLHMANEVKRRQMRESEVKKQKQIEQEQFAASRSAITPFHYEFPPVSVQQAKSHSTIQQQPQQPYRQQQEFVDAMVDDMEDDY